MLDGKFLLSFLMLVSFNAVAKDSEQSNEGYTERLKQRAEFVAGFAGEPIDSVKFRVYDGYEPLSTTSLIVYERGSRAYLLKVTPCWDLPLVGVISGIYNYMTIDIRFNAIYTAKMKCDITELRLVDYKAMKLADKENKIDYSGI